MVGGGGPLRGRGRSLASGPAAWKSTPHLEKSENAIPHKGMEKTRFGVALLRIESPEVLHSRLLQRNTGYNQADGGVKGPP